MSSAAQIAQWREDLEQLSSLRMRDSGDEYHDDDLAFIERAYSSFFHAIEAAKMNLVVDRCEELAAEILRESDLGDIEISVQDDMPMVSVRQDGSGLAVGLGGTIIEALSNYLEIVQQKSS